MFPVNKNEEITGERRYLLRQDAEMYDNLEDFLSFMDRNGDTKQELTDIWNESRVNREYNL